MEKISAIVLFHNNKKFELVINALLNQLYNNDEIIIVNDHSDEKLLDNIKHFANQENVFIINSDITGNRSRNRNLGANCAKNDNLLFVDGDIVLMDNCVNLIRLAFSSGYVGAFGNIIHGSNTPEQMNLLSGIDYLKFLESNPSLADFCKLDFAYDKRAHLIPENFIYRTEWQFFYSGYCAATKKAFFKCGQFNEDFKGWGAEDVEFGYRLEKAGDIKFLNEAYAYHISHNRDFYSIMQNNKKNLYLFYSQQTCALVEIYITFHLSTEIIDSIYYIKDKIRQMNLSDQHNLICKGQLSILPPSNAYPDGSVAYIDNDNHYKKLNLMGTALPFNDSQFEEVVLTTYIFCYPELISSKILQECYRVSKNVKILKNKQREHLRWSSLVTSNLFSRVSGMDRTNYCAHVINDFSFADKGGYYIITGGIATKMPYVHIDNLPKIYKNNNQINECLLFDLTGCLSNQQIEEIAKQKNLNIKGTYRLKLRQDQTNIRLSEIIFGELQLLNIPFVYLIPTTITIDKFDIWWNYKMRNNDKIYQI